MGASSSAEGGADAAVPEEAPREPPGGAPEAEAAPRRPVPFAGILSKSKDEVVGPRTRPAVPRLALGVLGGQDRAVALPPPSGTATASSAGSAAAPRPPQAPEAPPAPPAGPLAVPGPLGGGRSDSKEAASSGRRGRRGGSKGRAVDPPEDDVYVTDEVVGWQPKRRARPKLPPWEADSDGDGGPAQRDGRWAASGRASGVAAAQGEWGPFAAEGASKAAERVYRGEPRPAWATEGRCPDVLPSYEEEVLGLRRTGRTGGHFADEHEEQYRQELKEAARKEGLDLFDVSLLYTRTRGGGHWEKSDKATRRELTATATDALSIFTDPELPSLEDFDAEAEFLLQEESDAAGLVFRCDDDAHGSEHLLFAVNVEEETGARRVKLLQYPNQLGVNEYGELFCCDADEEDLPIGSWFQIRVRAVHDTVALFLEHRQIGQVQLGDSVRKSGSLGVWCRASSTVIVQHVVAVDLTKYSKSLDGVGTKVEEELLVNTRREHDRLADTFLATRASRVIQRIARLKLGLLAQRRRLFQDLEGLQREEKFREKSIRTWVTLLAVFSKLDKTLRDSDDLWAMKCEKTIDFLDAEDPPPLPPPVEKPPWLSR